MTEAGGNTLAALQTDGQINTFYNGYPLASAFIPLF